MHGECWIVAKGVSHIQWSSVSTINYKMIFSLILGAYLCNHGAIRVGDIIIWSESKKRIKGEDCNACAFCSVLCITCPQVMNTCFSFDFLPFSFSNLELIYSHWLYVYKCDLSWDGNLMLPRSKSQNKISWIGTG